MARETRILTGKVCAITGGARGIGRATAQALIREGACVALGDLDLDAAKKTAEELGPNARAFALDVVDESSFTAFLDAAEAELGPVDVLINNAGIMHLTAFDAEQWRMVERQVSINVYGVMHGMRVAIPRMLSRGAGHVVNISSAAGCAGIPGAATYSAAKHAVIGYTEAVMGELDGRGIDFTVVMPALVNTELAHGVRPGKGVVKSEPQDVADAIVRALKRPVFEVFVPKRVGPIVKFSRILPMAITTRVAKMLEADRILTEVDHGQRVAYEERARRHGAAAEATVAPAEAEREREREKSGVT